MENLVEQIKQKLNIVEVINRYVPLKKRGRNHLACCPFHGEKTPSFTVSEELQIYKCFGCGASGDVFSFLQEYEKIDFKEALSELAKLAGITLVKSEFSSQKDSVKKTLYDINQLVCKFYNYILLSHPLGQPALKYLSDRGIKPETIKLFNIGYSPENPALIINFLTKKGLKTPDLISTGTFGTSQYNSRVYDRFQGRLVFPLSDYRGRILGFSGRILPTSKNQNAAKYVNSPETEIYHKSQNLFGLHLAKDAIRTQNFVIVTEGEFDMISPFQSGVQNIVAIKGTAFTEEQLQLLRRYTDTLILALDSDFAGSNAAKKSIELADSMEFDIKVLLLGERYKDPDEAVRGDLEFFKKQLSQAVSVWDFIIQSQLKINDVDTVHGKKEILSNVLPFLVKIKNSVIRSDFYKKLADEIGSDQESILEEAKKYTSTSPVINNSSSLIIPPQKTEIQPPSKTEKLEYFLIILVLGSKNPAKLAQKFSKYLKNISHHQLKNITQNLLNITDFDPKSFQENLSAEIKPFFQSLFLEATNNPLDSKVRFSEISKIIDQIDNINLKSQLNQISAQIARLENSSQNEEIDKLEKEYNLILSQLAKIQTRKS